MATVNTIKKIADVERLVELARNDRGTNNPYTVNDTVALVNGTTIDITERTVELARNDYNKNNPYDINSID